MCILKIEAEVQLESANSASPSKSARKPIEPQWIVLDHCDADGLPNSRFRGALHRTVLDRVVQNGQNYLRLKCYTTASSTSLGEFCSDWIRSNG